MKKKEFRFISANEDVKIRAIWYIPEEEPKAILQIAHGMVEFIDRYEGFAEYLCDRGFLVAGNDHVGHGGSVNSEEDWGYFGYDGNNVLLDDMYQLYEITRESYPDLPYFLLGHSMGSFYARQYLTLHGEDLTGAIIMGTGHQPLAVVKAGMAMCKTMAKFKGWNYHWNFIDKISFGSYNKRFEPARTRADWLSKDTDLVDWYVNEPRCSFTFSLNAYYYMFEGIANLHDKKRLEQIPKDLPLFFVSGQDDPVGNFGKEVQAAVDSLKDVGVKNIDMKLYPNDRHEILNETDKEVVYEDLYQWMNQYIEG